MIKCREVLIGMAYFLNHILLHFEFDPRFRVEVDDFKLFCGS